MADHRLNRCDWQRWLNIAFVLLVVASPFLFASVGFAQDESKPAGEAQEHVIVWLIKTSGPIGAFLGVLSVYMVTKIIRLFTETKPAASLPPDVVDGGKALLDKRDFKGLYTLVKQDKSPFSTMVKAGMAELSNGLPEARAAIEKSFEMISAENEKKIAPLAVLGSLGPLIGLLGTLQGMIAAFGTIARSDQSMKANVVAGNISEALVITFEGVFLSVPAIFFYSFFKNRLTVNTVNTLLTSDEFVGKMAAAARSKTAGAG